jgi:hypothetical protein
METVGYCVRVQAVEGYADKIRAMPLVADYAGLLAVQHSGGTKENLHYHIVIRTDVKSQTFRKRMKALFPEGKGNQHMSIKHWDGDDKALSYLFHELDDNEKSTLIARKGLDDSRIEELRQLNNYIKIQVAEAKGKASHTLEEDAYLHFKELKQKHLTPTEIATFMFLHAMRAGKYPPQPWLVRGMVARVQFRLLEGNTQLEEKLAESFAKDIFERYN